MQSEPWKVTRSHQTNQSSAKAAYAFPKSNRFKENHAPMYPAPHPGATHSTTCHPGSTPAAPPASAKAAKCQW